MVVEFWAKASAASTTTNTQLQFEGASVLYGTADFTLGTVWQKFFHKITIPSGETHTNLRLVLRPPIQDGETVWYDDVRVYPSDAHMTTTYYDAKWRRPIFTVGVDNNPSPKVVFDNFGRPEKTYKINLADPTSNILLNQTEYHAMNELFANEKIRLTSPNGGEELITGELTQIMWVAQPNAGQVEISLSIDEGHSFETIDVVASSTGSYDWRVPATVSTGCLLKLIVEGDDDLSDGMFTIKNP
jgi:hypothetical protein